MNKIFQHLWDECAIVLWAGISKDLPFQLLRVLFCHIMLCKNKYTAIFFRVVTKYLPNTRSHLFLLLIWYMAPYKKKYSVITLISASFHKVLSTFKPWGSEPLRLIIHILVLLSSFSNMCQTQTHGKYHFFTFWKGHSIVQLPASQLVNTSPPKFLF